MHLTVAQRATFQKKVDDYFFTVGTMVINLKTFLNDNRVWYSRHRKRNKALFTIIAEIHGSSLANFYCQ